MSYTKEQRIQHIKDCGQSIIDNAENIYNDYKYPQGLKIIIDCEFNKVPTINVVRSFVPECLIERIIS